MFFSRIFWTFLFIGMLAGCSSAPTMAPVEETVPMADRPGAIRPEVVTPPKEEFVTVAQALPGPTIGRPTWFNTKEECIHAVQTGEYDFYSPKFFGGNNRNPVDGVTKVTYPFEAVHCVLMQTAIDKGAYKWVPQDKGTVMRFELTGIDTGRVYARDDCGNPVKDAIVVPFLKVTKVLPAPTCTPCTSPVVAVAPPSPVRKIYRTRTEVARTTYEQERRSYSSGIGWVIPAVVIGVAACFVSGICDLGGGNGSSPTPVVPPDDPIVNTLDGLIVNTK